MSTFLFVLLLFGVYFAVAGLLAVGFVACVFWLQERRKKALEATARWHCPDVLPADWDLTKERLR
jgi:hypothetical protein